MTMAAMPAWEALRCMWFVKLLSAFLSAVTLSAVFTLRERPSLFDHYSA